MLKIHKIPADSRSSSPRPSGAHTPNELYIFGTSARPQRSPQRRALKPARKLANGSPNLVWTCSKIQHVQMTMLELFTDRNAGNLQNPRVHLPVNWPNKEVNHDHYGQFMDNLWTTIRHNWSKMVNMVNIWTIIDQS